ncbi:amidohydrolase family protein [Klebsiella pneumoniae subsp. pneumoniae]|nr:amidohydrolase family protein [Klebsiella pneumoniae subsp. pneumoniae]
MNSTRQFMRELNRLGLTSAIDAGGGFQNYPEDYEVIEQLHAKDQMTVRIAYNLFTQRPKQELEDFERWTDMLKPGQGTDFYRANGAGEMLVFSAADFEDFLQPRRICRKAWRMSWSGWYAIWWSIAGRSACMPPTMSPSAGCWTCLRR